MSELLYSGTLGASKDKMWMTPGGGRAGAVGAGAGHIRGRQSSKPVRPLATHHAPRSSQCNPARAGP